MTGEESPVQPEVGVPGRAGQHAFDTNRAHQARMYDYFLGGKDNISQVVRGIPHTTLTGAVQARYGDYSKTASRAVR